MKHYVQVVSYLGIFSVLIGCACPSTYQEELKTCQSSLETSQQKTEEAKESLATCEQSREEMSSALNSSQDDIKKNLATCEQSREEMDSALKSSHRELTECQASTEKCQQETVEVKETLEKSEQERKTCQKETLYQSCLSACQSEYQSALLVCDQFARNPETHTVREKERDEQQRLKCLKDEGFAKDAKKICQQKCSEE